MPFWSLPARVLQQSSLFACGRFRCFPNSHSENILSKMRGKYLPLSILSFSPWQTSWYQDIYFPRSKYQGNIDGAYFGTTFPHLFLMTYGYLKPQKGSVTYTPRIFGFKVRSLVPNLQRFFCVLNSSVMQIRELNPDLLPTATRVLSSEALEWSIPDVSYTLHASSKPPFCRFLRVLWKTLPVGSLKRYSWLTHSRWLQRGTKKRSSFEAHTYNSVFVLSCFHSCSPGNIITFDLLLPSLRSFETDLIYSAYVADLPGSLAKNETLTWYR